MTATLETYDMQMLDYPNDLDIQMNASSSEQWVQDEVKMEEDGPVLMKTDGVLPMKTDLYDQEKGDVTIEVDMEPFPDHESIEYDMADDEEIHESGTDILDVEVYDASIEHSPSMGAVETVQLEQSNFHDSLGISGLISPVTLDEGLTTDPPSLGLEPLEPTSFPSSSDSVVILPPEHDSHLYAPHGTESDLAPLVELLEAQNGVIPQSADLLTSDTQNGGSKPEEHQTADEAVPLSDSGGQPKSDDSRPYIPTSGSGSFDQDEAPGQVEQEEVGVLTSANSSGDPHEISEGVYIDPPPPVLLSVGAENNSDFAFFNEPPEWNSSIAKKSESQNDRVLLHHLPTLYYEPLSTVFEALRQEEFVQSAFHLLESELFLDAIDLSLTISEDNIYAREVTLHDLNVLHDASEIGGLLRMRLHAFAPRFIARYQDLQEQVSQLHSEQPPGESAVTMEGSGAERSRPQSPPTDIDPDNDGSDHRLKAMEQNSYAQHSSNEPPAHISEATSKKNESRGVPSRQTNAEEQKQEQEEQEEDQHDDDTNPKISRPRSPNEGSDHVNATSSISPHHVFHSITGDEDQDPDLSSSNGSDGAVIGLDVLEAELNHQTSQGYAERHGRGSDDFSEEVSPSQEGEAEADDTVEDPEVEGGEADEVEAEELETEEPEAEEEVENTGGFEAELPEVHLQEEDEERRDEERGDHELKDVGSDEFIHLPDTTAEAEDVNGTTDENEDVLDHDPDSTDAEDHLANTEQEFQETGAIDGFSYLEESAKENQNGIENMNPDLPTEPIIFDGESWADDFEGERDRDTTWEDDNEYENTLSISNHSSVTLSSKASKRSFDEFESGGEGFEEEGPLETPSSPDPKRSRTQ